MPAALSFAVCALLLQSAQTDGQFLPPVASDLGFTIIRSPANNNVTIRFKTPPLGTCTTVFPTQKQYTGYVSLPPHTLGSKQQDYPVNTFFWFVEARTNPTTAPLTIYINGGPGSSSMVGLFQETGPCEVIEIAQGRFGTQVRDWGWDRSSNMLYVDQPNEVGFSYDTPTNGSLDLFQSTISFPPTKSPPEQPAYTFLNGTFSSNNGNRTANTTEIAAHTVWHMLQGFLGVFPQYNQGINSNGTRSDAVGVNLFAESYGGKYGPAFAAHWEKQNLLRRNGTISKSKSLEIRLMSLGILQGCVDDLVQGRFYPIFANNNTYNIQALSLADQQAAANSFLAADGCQQLIQSCRSAMSSADPSSDGNKAVVNELCQTATVSCSNNLIGPFQKSGRDIYDIAQKTPSSFPPSTYLEYLNSADVQAAIGVAVNYTETNTAVAEAFVQTGDYERGNQISEMAYLLSLGVRVALIYGDRDYICNWLGGEAVSFAIAAQSPKHSPFYGAGYADIVVNSTYVGGAVRQFGNLSFSRIYDAGHLIPAYQPETLFTVFTRIILGTGISLGDSIDLSTYSSNGTANATFTNTAPAPEEPRCFIRNIESSCTDEQKDMIRNGHGNIINGVLYNESRDWPVPASSMTVDAGYPGSVPSATDTPLMSSGSSAPATSTEPALTGVFVATSTPSPTKKGSATRCQRSWSVKLLGFIILCELFSLG